MKFPVQFLITGIVAGLSGCVSVDIKSNIKTEATPEFHRILVESRLPDTSLAYMSRFQEAFSPNYQVCILANSPTSFDDPAEAIREQQQKCQSEVLLTIDFYRNYTTGSGKYISTRNELLLELKNLATDQPFWKALVTTSGSNEVPPGRIVRKLIEDGLVEAVLPGGGSRSASR